MKLTTVIVCIMSLILAAKFLKVETRCTQQAVYSHGCLPNEKIEVNHACLVTEIRVVRK